MTNIDNFFEGNYPPGSYYRVLKKFLKNRHGNVSEDSIARLYYSLYPIGREWERPFNELNCLWLKKYVDELWLRYARDSVRTKIGDIRQFFKWCKKKRHHKRNIAKKIKPVRRRRSRHNKAAIESDIKEIMKNLADQLKTSGLVYSDIFLVPQAAESGWSYKKIKVLRNLFIITFLYETGARAGELSKLGTKAMNTAIAEPASAYMITVVGKTDDRDYFFTERTAELWRMWCAVRPDECGEYAVIGWGNGHKHNRIKTRGISRMINRIGKKVGVRPFRSHALRHAKIRRSRRKVGLEMASILVDHSDIDTTRGYANIDDEEIAAAAVKTGLKINLWK